MLSSISKPLAAVAIGVVAVFVGFSPARAVPVNVTYAISWAFFAPAAGAQTVLQGPGSLTVEFASGTAGGHVGAGALHVVSGSAMLTNNFTLFAGSLSFMGFQNVVFPGSGMGTVTAAGLFNLLTVGHIASGMVHCAGPACGLGGFVPSVSMNLTSGPRPINLDAPANLLVGFPSVGPQTFMAAGTGGPAPGGGNYVVNVTGQEVGRVVVPEPGTGLLLGVGLAGFGIAMTTWRARRRRA